MLEDLRRENEDLRGKLLATGTVTATIEPTPVEQPLSDAEAENALAEAAGVVLGGIPYEEPPPPDAVVGDPIALMRFWKSLYDAASKQRDENANLNLALEKQAEEREAKLKQRDEDLAVLGDEIKRLTGLNTMLTDQVGEVQIELAKAQERASAAEGDLVTLRESMRVSQSDLNLLKAVRDESYAKISQLQARIGELQVSLEDGPKGGAEQQKMRDTIASQQLQIASLRQAFGNAIFVLDSNGLEIPEQVDPEGQLEETIARNQVLVSDLNNAEKRIDELEDLSSALDTQLMGTNNYVAELARQLDAAKGMLAQAGTALERAMQPTIELINVQRGDRSWVEFRVSLDDGQTSRLAATLDASQWNGFLRLYPENLGIAPAATDATMATQAANTAT
jgi:hypothetical protein